MNIFKNHTYSWWQIGILKLALLSIGVVIGSYWQEALLPYITFFVAAAIVFGAYAVVASA